MKNSQAETKLSDNYVLDFLTETIPHFAADPEWRNIFKDIANLSEEEKSKMIRCLESNPISSGLIPEEQRISALAFLKLNLEIPNAPRMMVKMIDWENNRVEKVFRGQTKELMAFKSPFNTAEFVMDAFFQKSLPGATWRDVLRVCIDLSDYERTSYLELLSTPPNDLTNIPGDLTRLLVYNLENPSHAEMMIRAIDEGRIDLSTLCTSSRRRSNDQALA